jgi:hypothetical protein
LQILIVGYAFRRARNAATRTTSHRKDKRLAMRQAFSYPYAMQLPEVEL